MKFAPRMYNNVARVRAVGSRCCFEPMSLDKIAIEMNLVTQQTKEQLSYHLTARNSVPYFTGKISLPAQVLKFTVIEG